MRVEFVPSALVVVFHGQEVGESGHPVERPFRLDVRKRDAGLGHYPPDERVFVSRPGQPPDRSQTLEVRRVRVGERPDYRILPV